jgi:hypothetical protein
MARLAMGGFGWYCPRTNQVPGFRLPSTKEMNFRLANCSDIISSACFLIALLAEVGRVAARAASLLLSGLSP